MKNLQSLLAVLIFVGCQPKSQNSKESIFAYCSVGSPSIFNPQLASDGPSFNASSQPLYNRLLSFKKGTTELVPSLAESWTVSSDQKTYIFKLSKGVKFHSGFGFKPTRELQAQDVVFTFNRMLKKDHAYHSVNGGGYEYFKSMEMDKIIKSVKALSPDEVEFQLTKPEAPFLANLAMDFASILSAEYGDYLVKNNKRERMDFDPIGTGPFTFKSYSKDSLIRYEANKNYFKTPPKVNKLVFAITPDPSVRLQKLKKQECHLITEPHPSDLTQIMKNPSLKLKQTSGMNVGYLAFNTKHKDLKKKALREALSLALNRKAYIKAIYLGNATLAKNPIPPNLWSYREETPEWEYSPSKSKKMLLDLGYKPGDLKLSLWTLPVSRPYNPSGKKMGEMMQADFKKVGVDIRLQTYDWPTYLEKARKGEHDLIQLGWSGDNGDPDNFLGVLLSCAGVRAGSNSARWCHKKFDEQILKAKTITDQNQRTVFYKEAQKIFFEEKPWVPLVHSTIFRGINTKVKAYRINPLGTEDLSGVSLSSGK